MKNNKTRFKISAKHQTIKKRRNHIGLLAKSISIATGFCIAAFGNIANATTFIKLQPGPGSVSIGGQLINAQTLTPLSDCLRARLNLPMS